MKLLEDRIRAEGRILPGDIIKVDGFLNHRVDVSLLRECAKEFGAEHRQAIRDNEATYLAELEAAGMEVGYPDTAPFIEQAQSVYTDFYAENDWAEDLVARINELK